MDCAFKIHAVCGLLFTAIDAAIALRHEHSLTPAQITRIRVALPEWVRNDAVFTRRRPETVGVSRFSVPFAVAAALRDGEVTLRQISEEGIHDETIAELEAKIEVVADPKVDQVFNATKNDEFFLLSRVCDHNIAEGKDYYPHG